MAETERNIGNGAAGFRVNEATGNGVDSDRRAEFYVHIRHFGSSGEFNDFCPRLVLHVGVESAGVYGTRWGRARPDGQAGASCAQYVSACGETIDAIYPAVIGFKRRRGMAAYAVLNLNNLGKCHALSNDRSP